MGTNTLRRYTNLAATIHLLQGKCLTLLSPSTWDDRNDAYFMDVYKKRVEAKSLLALCFAQAAETYHHWRVFSAGSDGICLELDKRGVKASIADDARFKGKSVDYRKIDELGAIEPEDLPFLKR